MENLCKLCAQFVYKNAVNITLPENEGIDNFIMTKFTITKTANATCSYICVDCHKHVKLFMAFNERVVMGQRDHLNLVNMPLEFNSGVVLFDRFEENLDLLLDILHDHSYAAYQPVESKQDTAGTSKQ